MRQGDRYERDAAQITVKVRGKTFEGWLQSEVTRDIEAICGTFSIPVTLVPGSPPEIERQDEVEVFIGATKVITGYVLGAEPFYTRQDCGMRIVGRDRTGDLVRASAVHKGGQWRGAKLDRIARDLVSAYGIQVKVDADVGAAIGDFKLYHGETVLAALSRAARLRGLLVTRDNDGRLLLTKAGVKRFAGSIVRGTNVISMEGVGSDEMRASEYIVYGQANSVDDFEYARGLKAAAKDPEIKRHMPLVINADGNTTQAELEALVRHTVRVRRGHAYGIKYVVEGWTWKGEAWPVNERVAIFDDVAGMDGTEWLIASVRQSCSRQEGDVTELVVRPVEAYDTVPLQSKPKRRHWGNAGNRTNHPRGPRDKSRGGY
ncbi:MAG: phage baseplate assembly protein [Gammaproteobacteria bacterium]|jgi:prophage tail gpP-like protein